MKKRRLHAILVCLTAALIGGAVKAASGHEAVRYTPVEVSATSSALAEGVSLASSDDRGCCLLRTRRPFKAGNQCTDNSWRDSCARAASAAGLSSSDWDFYKETRCEDVSACPD